MTSPSAAPGRLRAFWGGALLLLAACAPAPGPAAAPPSPFNATDTAWLQLMIPMDEQLLPALDLAPPEYAPLVVELRQGNELARLRELRTAAGLSSDDNPHEGHQMPGLVTAADLAALRLDPSGFGTELREYLDQSVLLAKGEQDNGAAREVKELAGRIGATRAAQRVRLDGIGSA